MANHVENYIHIEANEECLKEFDSNTVNIEEDTRFKIFTKITNIKVKAFNSIDSIPRKYFLIQIASNLYLF